MYDYRNERQNIFSEDGQKLFLQIRDRANYLLKIAGAFTMEQAICESSGNSWDMLACIDRMVELGELLELPNPHSRAGQHRVFTRIVPL